MENKRLAEHLAALLTIAIWGTTFISTKILLADFQPVEILFFRLAIGLLALLAAFVWACYSVLSKRSADMAAIPFSPRDGCSAMACCLCSRHCFCLISGRNCHV